MSQSKNLRESRAKLVADAQALIPADGKLTPEVRTQFDSMMVEVETMKSDIDRLERVETAEAELRSVKLDLPNPGANAPVEKRETVSDEVRSKAEEAAFRADLRGIATLEQRSQMRRAVPAETRDQNGASGASGGFLIPQSYYKVLTQELKSFVGPRQVAYIMTTASGALMPMPLVDETAQKGSILGAGQAASEQDVTFSQVNLGAYTYTSGLVRVANELLQDSAFDLMGYVRKFFVDRIGRIQNDHFTFGTGVSQPRGFLLDAPTVTPTGVTAATFIDDNLIDLVHSVDPAYRANAKYMLHDTTLSVIKKMKDNQGRYLWQAGIAGGAPDTINGLQYVINQSMDQIGAGKSPLAFGDWSNYVIRDIEGISYNVLRERFAEYNETGFVMFMRSDARLLDTRAIAVLAQPAS